MGIDFTPAADMSGLEDLGRGLERACLDLDLSKSMTQWVAAAGVSALSSVILAGAANPRLTLEKGLSQVTLSLEFTPAPEARETTPPGLAAGLYSPPALRVELRREGERPTWSAVWEA